MQQKAAAYEWMLQVESSCKLSKEMEIKYELADVFVKFFALQPVKLCLSKSYFVLTVRCAQFNSILQVYIWPIVCCTILLQNLPYESLLGPNSIVAVPVHQCVTAQF